MKDVYVITGATSGIGRAIAKRIAGDADKNTQLFLIYGHDEKNAKETLREINDISDIETFLIKSDLSEYDGIDIVLDSLKEHTDHIDHLVLNTGISTYMPFEEYTPETWENIMRTNLNVPVFLVKKSKGLIRKGGSVLFMGSHAGQATYSSSLVYSVSKAAVMFAARSMVKLFDEQGVRVNAIAPGFIETRWQASRSEESYERINNKIALHRFGTPDEVAELCYHVMNNAYLNGGIYDIHGGYDYF